MSTILIYFKKFLALDLTKHPMLVSLFKNIPNVFFRTESLIEHAIKYGGQFNMNNFIPQKLLYSKTNCSNTGDCQTAWPLSI